MRNQTTLNILKTLHRVAIVIAIGIIVSCAAKSSDTPKSDKSTNATNTQPPLQTPSAQSTISTIPIDPLNVPKQSCWDQILKSPEALACTTMFVYSSKTCVPGVIKQASCTRDDVNNAYGNSTVSGQPVMTQVDQWIAEGYQPNQCAIGSDQKLYVYFVKQNFVPKEQGTDNMNHYTVADKSLGPGGAILTSIRLETNSPMSSTTCD